MYFYPEHKYLMEKMGIDQGVIHDIEHFRIPTAMWPYDKPNGAHGDVHVAVIASIDGSFFVGMSFCAKSDQYNHRVGYFQSVKKALQSMCRNRSESWLVEWPLYGRELREAVRSRMGLPKKVKANV